MASVRYEIVIGARPELVWDVLRDVGAVHQRLLPGRVTATRIEGDQRFLTFPDGHVVRELIATVDDEAQRLAYSVVEGARPPAQYHHASFEVRPEGTRAARLIWITDVLPHTLADLVRVRMERGATEMKAAIEAEAAVGGRQHDRTVGLALGMRAGDLGNCPARCPAGLPGRNTGRTGPVARPAGTPARTLLAPLQPGSTRTAYRLTLMANTISFMATDTS